MSGKISTVLERYRRARGFYTVRESPLLEEALKQEIEMIPVDEPHVTTKGEVWIAEYWSSDRKSWIPTTVGLRMAFVEKIAVLDAIVRHKEKYKVPDAMKYRARKWIRAEV